MKIFETHAHLYMKDFDEDRDDLIKKCFKNNVEYIINIGVNKETSLKSMELAKKHKNIYCSIGFHPHDADKYDEIFIKGNINSFNVVAIGEIGLDYYRNLSPKEIQITVFKKQIEIALANNMPIIIHDRDAHKDCFDILNEYKTDKVVFHSFSGDEIFAEAVLSQGWFIAFNGIITFKKNRLENIVRMVPNDKFFVETDSPYLAPHPNRGKRNSPLNIRYIIEKIAEIKEISPKDVANLSYKNAFNFFNIGKLKKWLKKTC